MATSALNISLIIGAALSGSFGSAISGAKSGLEKIGKGVEELTRMHKRMGDVMSQSLSHPMRTVGALRGRYDQLGAAIRSATREQEKMSQAMNRMASLKAQRGELRSELMDRVAVGYAVGAPLTQSVRIAASYEDQIKDIAITGNLGKAEEMKLGKALRENALRINQTQDALVQGVSILVANGMTVQQAQQYSSILGKTATATRGSMQDLSQLMFALSTSFKIDGEKGMKEALDAMAHAGKKGQFELKEMARYFPELGASMASFGATGLQAVKELGMAMQVARKYSGTNEEAARNAANWFSHMTAGATVKHFGDVGIDYQSELMKRMREQKISALQASLQVTDAYIDKVSAGQTIAIKDGKKTKQLSFREALDAAKASGNETEIKSVVERFGLSKVFQDMQTVNFYMAMRQGKEMFKEGMASFDTAEAKGVVDRDYAKRMEATTEQFKTFKIATAELGISIGGLLLPSLNGMVQAIKPVVDLASRIAATFPTVTKTVIGLTVGMVAGGVVLTGFSFLSNMAATSMAALKVGIHGARAAVALMRGTMIAGNSTTIFTALSATRFAPIVTGIKSISMAIRALNIGMLANPVGLAIAGVAVAVAGAAFLIYKYWYPIKSFFKGVWLGLKSSFEPTIKSLKESFAPLAPAFKAIGSYLAPVIGWFKSLFRQVQPTAAQLMNATIYGGQFGKALAFSIKLVFAPMFTLIKLIGTVWSAIIKLSKMNLFQAGANIFKTLVDGMKSMVTKPVEVMKGLAQRLRNFLPFSPAKEGALRDIHKVRLIETIADSMQPAPMVTAMRAVTAATMLATAAPSFAAATAKQAVQPIQPMRMSATANGVAKANITFAPVINLSPGTPAEARQQVEQALKLSQVEFERMLARAEQNKQRKGFV